MGFGSAPKRRDQLAAALITTLANELPQPPLSSKFCPPTTESRFSLPSLYYKEAYYQFVRYTPRRAKSIWSQKNVNTVAKLIETGRMRPAGLAAVEAAKADGRWDRAYAGPSTIAVPDDFAAVLKEVLDAATFFETLNKSDRYAVLWRVQTATPTARPGRIETLVQMLAEKKRPTFTKSAKKRKGESKDGKIEEIEKRDVKKVATKPRRRGLRSDPDFNQ